MRIGAVWLMLVSGFLGAAEEGAFVVADGDAASAVASGSTVEAFDTGEPERGSALRWTAGGEDRALLSIRRLPGDLRPFRSLRMRVRAPRRPGQAIYVYFSSDDGDLEGVLPAPDSDWREIELLLPNLAVRSGFDPGKAEWFQLGAYQPGPFTLEIDDVRLVPAEGGWRWTPEEERARKDAPVLRLADFETTAGTPTLRAEQSTASVEEPPGAGGHVLRWVQAKSADGGWLTFRGAPEDVSGYRWFRFRARMAGGTTDGVYFRFNSGDGVLEAPLPEVGPEWRTIEFLLPEMTERDGFDPQKLAFYRFVCFGSEGFTMELDDFELRREGAGWRWSAEERREMGIDTAAPRYRIADFEREAAMARLLVRGGVASRVPEDAKKRRGGSILRWELSEKGGRAALSFVGLPADIREYRSLRFRARASGRGGNDLRVALQCTGGSCYGEVRGIDRKWAEIVVELPSLTAEEGFDAKAVRWLTLGIDGVEPNSYEFDDFELVKGAGGWKRTAEEQLVHVFGADRVRKVKTIETDHFVVTTDSAAAQQKFPRALEKAYEFVCERLGLGGMEGRLPVYIFQNSELYFGFCERQGWPRSTAEGTAGHAGEGYFATYYQAPDSATVTHELTHAIFGRAIGEGGGSWFQEGVAVYVEELWQKRSVAETFAPRARSGDLVHLAAFLNIPTLASEEDVTGGPRSPGALYQQAGAFFEWLRRGPPAEATPGAVAALAVLDDERAVTEREVERILGGTLNEIEARWIEWAKDPPKERRR